MTRCLHCVVWLISFSPSEQPAKNGELNKTLLCFALAFNCFLQFCSHIPKLFSVPTRRSPQTIIIYNVLNQQTGVKYINASAACPGSIVLNLKKQTF